MKRITAALVCVLPALSLTACGLLNLSGGDNSDGDTSTKDFL